MNIKEAAQQARKHMMPADSDNEFQKIIVDYDAPQWVCDIINTARDEEDIVDQQRQLFVLEAIDLIRRNQNVGDIDRNDDYDAVMRWFYETPSFRGDYVEEAKADLQAENITYTKFRLFAEAEKLEREEMYYHVREQLKFHVGIKKRIHG